MFKNMSLIFNKKPHKSVIINAALVMTFGLASCGPSPTTSSTEHASEAMTPTTTATATAVTPSSTSIATAGVAGVTPSQNLADTSTATNTPVSTSTSTSAPTKTPTVLSTNQPTKITSTPVQSEASPSSTNTKVAPTATPTTQSEGLLPAPVPAEPANGAVFSGLVDASQILLKWNAIKPTLSLDELYLITIRYNHQGQVFTDYAWTQQPNWSVGEHNYLGDLTDDGLFKWTVMLIRQTGTNSDGIPEGPALSRVSTERSFVWQAPTSNGGDNGNSKDNSDSNDNGGGGYP